MGLGDFWLQFNNGKKEQLNDTKHGVRKEQVDKKFHNLFDAYDANNDGTLEENEVQTIFGHLKNFAGDNVLDSAENLKAKSVFADQVGMQDVDFQGFIKSVSDATSNIISSEETKTSDGGKEIKTEYKDGTTEIIAYYSNGDFKWKKIEKRFAKTTYEMILDGKRQELTEEQYNQALKKLNEKPQPQQKPKATFGIEGQNRIVFPQPTPSVEVKTTTNKWEEHTQEYSPRFIAEKLGVDINTEEGQKILERMSYLPKEALDQIKDGAELKDIIAQNDLPPNFDNISNVLELMYDVTLRNEEEYEGSKLQREKIVQQIQTVGIMSELYARVAEFNDTYTDNQGLFGMGAEGIGYLLNKVGIQGENHYQWADSCREFIEKINNFKVLNPDKFDEEFKELTGKDNFNIDALQKMVQLSKSGKAQDEYGNYTEEFKQAVKDFSNFDVSNPNAKAWYHPDNLLNGFGEALIMIMTLGWGAETKAGQMLATSTMATFGKAGVTIASRQVNNKLLQGALRYSGQAVKLIGPAINEGTKMYSYTAVTGTASNIANRAIKFDSEENSLDKFLQTEAMVLDSATGSFGFGAFAGVFGSTVTQKVMQRASRVSTKVGTALSDKFAKGAVDANEVFTTILEKSAPTKIAEVAAFVTDVLGFTAFESVLAIVKNLDNYPDGYSVEDLTNVIWEELKSQGYNLGQIKIVAWLLSSRSARMQATRYMKDAMPQLKGASVEGVNGGKDGYKINLPDGRKIECKNTTEYISALHLMIRGETAFSSKFDVRTASKGTETSDVVIPTQAEVKQMNFEDMFARLKNGHVNYTLSTTEDGRKLVKIEDYKTLSSNRFDYYEFDSEGKLVKSQVKTSETTAKDLFKGFENAKTRNIQNRGGRLNVGVPIMDMAESVDAALTARNVRNEVGNTENQAVNPASIISATEPQVTPYEAGLVNGHYFNQDASDFVKQMGDAGISMNTAKAVVSAVYSRFVGGEFGEPSKELKDFTISKLTNEFKDNPSEFTNFINSLHSCLDFRNPTSAEVVKRLFEVKAEGKLPEGTFEAFRVNNYFRNIDGRIFSNAKEIVDIIIDYPEYSQFLQKFASAHAHRTEYDTQSARKLCEVLKKLGMEKFYDFLIPYGNHEIFMDLVNKVDIDKYPEEFRALLENTGSYNDFEWDTNTTAEDINFVMELTRLARKKQPDEYSRWSFIENVCKIKTQEAKDFVIEYVKNSGSCYADTDITKALNEKPEIYPLVIKYMDEIYRNSPNNIYVLMELFKSNPSQETLDFFMTSEPSLSRGRYEYGYLVLANAKDSEFLNFAIDNLAERDGSYSALDRAIRNFDVMNLDVLRYLLEAKDSHGNFVFEYSDITRQVYKTRDGKPFRLDLDKIKSLAEQRYPDGKHVFDRVGDVTKVAIRYKEDAQALIDNEPPQKQLDAYTLYERTYKLMQDEVSKFGCKTFKEFEELIPTLQGKDRAEGGKLLGKIKKQTIDTFLSELSNDAIVYLSSGSGSFTAKDMDNAIQKMNNNPVLRKYLEDIEETGTIKIENNLEAKRYFKEQKELEKEDENDETELIPVPLSPASAVASFNQLEKALLSDDKTLVQTMKNSIIIDKSDAPRIKKDYLEIKSLYNILMKKYVERLSKEQLDAYGGDIEAFADANDYTFKPSVCIDALSDVAYQIGAGKVSALVHNEAPAKCMEYISQIRRLFAVVRDVPETKDNLFKIMKNPKLKDNDFKAVLSCLSGIINSGNKELFIATVDKLASKDKIDGKNIYKDVYSVIKQECGLNPEVTDTEIEGWSMDYLPYVLRALYTISGQPAGELNVTWLRELIRTAGNRGEYEAFLFNPETENGKLNIESRRIFGNEKLNFDQFMNFNGKTEFDFHIATLELEPIRKSIAEDLTNMKNEPSIKTLFEEFAQKEGLVFEPSGKITLNGKDITEQEDLLNFVTKINKFISDNSKIISKSPIADVKDHFSARKSQISRSITDGLNSGLMTISLWGRDVKHDLFQGHYCQCCVSMDGCNNHSIIQSLSHTVDQIAELKTADGTTVGKVKMLFLKDTKTGEPILLANGFEIISPYMNNDLIRDQFVNFMREYAKAVCGKEVPIYTGMTYQKINYEELPDVEGNFQLLGKTPDNTYHLDSYNYSDVPSSHPTELDKPHNMQLKILYKPKN